MPDEPDTTIPPVLIPGHGLLRVSKWLVGAAVATVLILVGGQLYVTVKTYENSKTTNTIVQGHNQELQHIESLATSIHNLQLDDTNGKKIINGDIAAVASHATALANEVAANHANGSAGQRAICSSINGIVTSLHLTGVPTCVIPKQ